MWPIWMLMNMMMIKWKLRSYAQFNINKFARKFK
jgi:hypothetical protein